MSSSFQLAKALEQLYKEAHHPFPYGDCRKILRDNPDMRFSGLIPDLDVYFSLIVGRASYGKRILRWPKEQIEQIQTELRRSFFDQFPVYLPLREQMTSSPDLGRDLAAVDTMRDLLLKLLSRLQKGKSDEDEPSSAQEEPSS